MFKLEFDLCMNSVVNNCREIGSILEYEVTIKEKGKAHFVQFDASDGSVICSCKEFEYTGIQCCHILKVLDLKNVKELPPVYVLRRWRKNAKLGTLAGDHWFVHGGDPNLSYPKQYGSLCRMLYKIAARAAEKVEAYTFMESQSGQLLEQIEQILQTRLLENTPLDTASKGHQQNLGQAGSVHHKGNCVSKRVNGKNKDGSTRHRHSSEVESSNKRKKGRKGQLEDGEVSSLSEEQPVISDEVLSSSSNPSNQFLVQNQLIYSFSTM